jgi:hypothetical protein
VRFARFDPARPMSRGTVFVTSLVIAVASFAAGCGGDAALTRTEYVSQLNAMCEDFAAREKEIGEPHSLSDLAERGDRIADAFDQAIGDKVRTLEAPGEIAAQAGRLRAVAEQQGETLRGLAEAASRGDLSRVRTLAARNSALNSEASDQARQLGADSCA